MRLKGGAGQTRSKGANLGASNNLAIQGELLGGEQVVLASSQAHITSFCGGREGWLLLRGGGVGGDDAAAGQGGDGKGPGRALALLRGRRLRFAQDGATEVFHRHEGRGGGPSTGATLGREGWEGKSSWG